MRLLPSRNGRLARNHMALFWRQRFSSSLPAFGGAQLGEGNSMRVLAWSGRHTGHDSTGAGR
jgi:hypothetical protein